MAGEIKVDDQGRTALHGAACIGQELSVRRLLAQFPNMVSVVDQSGSTALHLAASEGHHKIVEALVAHSPQLTNATDEYSRTALHIASRKGHVLVVDALLAANSNFSWLDEHGCSALHLAAQEGHVEVVKRLVAVSPRLLDPVDERGRSILHWAARRGHAKVVEVLIAHNPLLVNAFDNYGYTPLHAAALGNHEQVMEQLLTCNPNIDASTPTGLTALHIAAQGGYAHMVALLLAEYSKLSQHDIECHAVDERTPGDDPSATTDDVELKGSNLQPATTIHVHAEEPEERSQNNNSDTEDPPKPFKPDLLSSINSRGQTALHLAAERGHQCVAKMLLDYKPQLIFALDGEGNTILHMAAHACGADFVAKLWSMNMTALQAVNCNQQTPFLVAIFRGNEGAVEWIHRKMCFDDVANAFASSHHYLPRLRQLVTESVEGPLQANLIRDVVHTITGYLINELLL